MENFHKDLCTLPGFLASGVTFLVAVVLSWCHLIVLVCGWIAAALTRLARWWLGIEGA
jgi:hypothetical protein